MNNFEEFKKKIKKIENKKLIVGWADSTRYPSGKLVSEVAIIQEYGNGKIPARPFMKPAKDKFYPQWAKIFGATYDWEILGQSVRADIQLSIENVNSPKLAPLTIALRNYKHKMGISIVQPKDFYKAFKLKGWQDYQNQHPLIDTSLMLDSVDFKII